MQRVTRRELHREAARILDGVLDSGEPVEVVTRGRGSVIVSRKSQSNFETWVAQGLVRPAEGRLDRCSVGRSDRSTEEMLADVRDDR